MYKTTMKISLALTLAGVLGLSACSSRQSENQSQLIPLLQDSQKIISTRPQTQSHIMALVKLKTPALLETSKTVNGVTSVDQDQLEAILKEQEATFQAFKNISPDIQIIYKYKYVLNALTVLAPKEALDKISSLGIIASWETVGLFKKPVGVPQSSSLKKAMTSLKEKNATKFIGAEKLHEQGLKGKGIRVGVIDTGIDYTHAMLKGVGTAEAYKAIDPDKEAIGFPNDKVVGGVDLVGSYYDSASADFIFRIPKPDLNPLDEGGHGTHVAGTIAGIGDGVATYDGVAPEADLYAIKVFGAEGSTSDMVVIAALEYSVDPNGDGDLRDQLDVVNLSLGSGYGNPKILYAEAIKNLVRDGTVAAISAGNSGPNDYIVGAPGTSTEALSVAASIDNADHNWKFAASQINIDGEVVNVEAVNAATTKPAQESNVSGPLVYIGLAKEDLTEAEKQAVKGKVALIDRGVVAFNDKVKRAAEAGAIGVVLANNQEGAPFGMGTTDKFLIPAIMITKKVGESAKLALAAGKSVSIQFTTDILIEKPELIDTITSFSSKGPRSMDGYLKPEISAPGSDIISAAMGKGAEPVKMSGTSMAAPQIAGVLALVKESFEKKKVEVSALELKNIVMGTAKTISEKGVRYPVTLQGSGRVQVDKAAEAQVVAKEPSISFGEIAVETKKQVKASVNLKTLTGVSKTVGIEFVGNEFIKLNNAQSVTLKADEYSQTNLMFTLDTTKMKNEYVRELDGWVLIKENGVEIYRIPVLAVAHKLSLIKPISLDILSSRVDAEGAQAQLKVKNLGHNPGDILLFNMLSKDDRKPVAPSFMNADCDMESVGYRIISKVNADGEMESYIQFGVKVYKPMTTWNSCDVSILIDADKDGVADQELLGANMMSIPNESTDAFASTLLDATKARALRKAYEEKVVKAMHEIIYLPKTEQLEKLQKIKDEEKYTEAIIDVNDMLIHNNSTVVVVEARVNQLKLDIDKLLNFKVIVSHNEYGSMQMDDVLANDKMFSVSVNEKDQAFMISEESYVVDANSEVALDVVKGRGNSSLLVLMPKNKNSFSDYESDSQSDVLKGRYTAP